MVVGKVMRWSPWAPAVTRKKKFQVKLRVTRLEGLPSGGVGNVAAVEIRWNGPPDAGGLSYLRRRKKQMRNISSERPVRDDGVVEWEEDEKAGEFENVCAFSTSDSDPNSVSTCNSFGAWDVSFSLLHGYRDEQGRKKKKLEDRGTKMVNLAEWAWAFQLKQQEQEAGVEGKESQFHVQRKQLPITIRNDGVASEATLHVTVSFVEVRTASPETIETDQAKVDKESQKEEDTSDGRTTDESCTFDSDSCDLAQLLQVAPEEDKLVTNNNLSSSGGSSPDPQVESSSRRGFLSWRRKRRKKNSRSRETQHSSSPPQKDKKKESSGSEPDEDPVGSWEEREFISRDRQTKLKAHTFFASIDQRNESAGGESACTVLVAVIADALHSNGVNTDTPTRSEFDALIREGSSEWRKLCDNESYINRFPNKHFDLDTILEAKIRPISEVSEKSFIGFFQPESFESLRGAMSFDDIWDEITSNVDGDPKVYIVSWNDHFFVLKVEGDVYYIMDTLGERLFEGCNKAYILRFDSSTEMYRLLENDKDGDGERDGDGDGSELICSGKKCCKEFITRFLAAIPLREELDVEEKGMGTNTALHQRLQIEFHFAKASNQVVIGEFDTRGQ